jgi:hypothetical protein
MLSWINVINAEKNDFLIFEFLLLTYYEARR